MFLCNCNPIYPSPRFWEDGCAVGNIMPLHGPNVVVCGFLSNHMATGKQPLKYLRTCMQATNFPKNMSGRMGTNAL